MNELRSREAQPFFRGNDGASNLVLAMCGELSYRQLAPFLRSAARCAGGAQVVLLLHRNPPGTREALQAAGARAVEVELPGVPEARSYNVARWALFAGALEGREGGRVLLCDCRDLIFQRDPFALELGPGVHLFEEHPAKDVGACIWTSSWIRYRYGDAALPPLAREPIVCSGVMLGDARAVRELAEQIAAEIDPALAATHYMAGYDQGVVNVLSRTRRMASLSLHPYPSTPVLHLGNAPKGSVRQAEDGTVLNDAGEAAAIVHQYDRHPEIAARLLPRLG